jgi:ubiquinone/menaquinone biosynthesis C-methylase UbiE
MFHELPAAVRQTVIEQCFRVIKPGGVFIICDSIQISDSPDLVDIINNFPRTFHEPYYINYSLDNLVARLEKAGFTHVGTEVHFLSKYIIACKPD